MRRGPGRHEVERRLRRAPKSEARDEAFRVSAWRAVQQILNDSVPVAWLYHSRGVQGLSARLHNVTMDLRGEMVSITDWSIQGRADRDRKVVTAR